MSAQARGDQNDGEWQYYTADGVFEYQEQQVVGNGTSSITYQDTVAVGSLPYTFEYEDLAITGYQERTAEYSRYTLADSYTLTALYDWTRKIVGTVDAVVLTYWDQVLVAEEREFSYWDWTPAGTTTHYAVVTEQNQTFDPASFTYLTWEQGADGVWQQVEKQQSYQIEQWYTSETELPYTVQEWEKTLKKVTYTVHHTEWVKKEVMGSYPVFERYKIYYGQTKYVYEMEYVPVDYTTALICKVLKTVDYSTTILGTETKELTYDTPLIGTVTNRIEYEVMERCQGCRDEFPWDEFGSFMSRLTESVSIPGIEDLLADILDGRSLGTPELQGGSGSPLSETSPWFGDQTSDTPRAIRCTTLRPSSTTGTWGDELVLAESENAGSDKSGDSPTFGTTLFYEQTGTEVPTGWTTADDQSTTASGVGGSAPIAVSRSSTGSSPGSRPTDPASILSWLGSTFGWLRKALLAFSTLLYIISDVIFWIALAVALYYGILLALGLATFFVMLSILGWLLLLFADMFDVCKDHPVRLLGDTLIEIAEGAQEFLGDLWREVVVPLRDFWVEHCRTLLRG